MKLPEVTSVAEAQRIASRVCLERALPYKTATFAGNHRLRDGDIIEMRGFVNGRPLRDLLTRPRVRFVRSHTATSFDVGERRATWGEWFRMLRREIVRKLSS